MKRYAFRVDSSLAIGTGHIFRCRVLARLLVAQNAEVYFICRTLQGNSIDLLSQEFQVLSLPLPSDVESSNYSSYSYQDWLPCSQRTDVIDTINILQQLDNQYLDGIIVDHYSLDCEWESFFRQNYFFKYNISGTILAIDDLANRRHDCDILLDPNYFADSTNSRYSHLVPPNCTLALGPHYALLDPQFSLYRSQLRQRSKVSNVLIFFGGNDYFDLTSRVVEVLSSPQYTNITFNIVLGSLSSNHQTIKQNLKSYPNFLVHSNLPNLADLMLSSELYIGSGGTTTWERSCLGLRSIVITTAENQIELTKCLANTDDIVYLGHANNVTNNQILSSFQSSLNLSNRPCGYHYTDGFGAFRVCLALCQQHVDVQVREAVASDVSLLWRWANDTSVRNFSFSPSFISYASHTEWFSHSLVLSSRHQFISYDNSSGLPLGQVRFDYDDSTNLVVIDISIDALFRGLGFASLSLKKSISKYLKLRSHDFFFEARILKSNISSQGLFSGLGFNHASEYDSGDYQVWRLSSVTLD